MKRLCMGCMRTYDDRYTVCPYCGYVFGSKPAQPYHMEAGTVLCNRYIVGKVLGFGGFGVTYLGWDHVMARRVAVKEYLPGEFATREPGTEQVTVFSGERSEQFRAGMERMLQEARQLAKLDGVDSVVRIFDCFEANGTSYIVMEYLEGMTLKAYLEANGPMPVGQALPVVLQLAAAMEQVHREEILHRDIAPDNIFILNPEEPDSLRVKLLDFGAARHATSKHSKSLSVLVKAGYAPEEQYRSRGDQGPWTDVYALAATFYKMLTDITPEDALDRRVKDEVKRPSQLGVDLPKSVETALMNAMNVRIEDRTQSMEQFSRELLAAEVDVRRATKDKGPGIRIPAWLWALFGTGVAAAGVTGALMVAGVIRFRPDAQVSRLERNIVRVPNVVNLEESAAGETLKSRDLSMVIEKPVYSDEIPEDMICYQNIKENSQVNRGSEVDVWVSKGPQKAELPFVVGLTQKEAIRLLAERGFSENDITVEERAGKGENGTVLAVSEAQGELVALSTPLTLTVCRNAAEYAAEAAAAVPVPGLLGLGRAEAEQALKNAGFSVSWVPEYSDEPEDTILSQDPEPGAKAAEGSVVRVSISRGSEKVYMEYVKNIPLSEARQTLEDLGLAAGKVTYAYSDSVPEGNVISQSIPQGEQVAKGTAVDLTVSSGRKPAATEAAQTTDAGEASRAAAEAAAQESRRAAEAAAAQSQAEAAAASRAAEEVAAASRAAEEAAAASRAAEEAAAASRAAEESAAASRAAEESRRAAESAANVRVVATTAADGREEVPDLLYDTRKDAVETIRDCGFRVGDISYAYSDEVEKGSVCSQSPREGRSAKKGSRISIVISLGPEETEAETEEETEKETEEETEKETEEKTEKETPEETKNEADLEDEPQEDVGEADPEEEE